MREIVRNELRIIQFSGFIGIWVGILNSFISAEPMFWNAVTGALTGLVTSFSITAAETFLFARWLRRVRFFIAVSIRTAYYASMVIIWLTLSYGFEKWLSLGTFVIIINRSFFVVALLILTSAFLLNVYNMFSRLVGRNVIRYFLTGKYHRPVEEDRIFMFLDLKGSTEIAEKLGDLRYQDFLNDFLFDISDSIMRTKGEIYKYVGDAVIVSWPVKVGLRQGNCIRCYQSICTTTKRVQNRYLQRYGISPEFRVGLHGGPVITCEIGDNKREIAFLGDVVNTAARLQEECKEQGVDCLISGELFQNLRNHTDTYWFRWEHIADVRLRGKEHETELIRVWF